MARYHGKKGVVYMSPTGTGTAVNVIMLNTWTLDRTTDLVEVTAFGDVNKVHVQGLPDVSGTVSGFWDDTSDAIYDGAISADGVNFYLYPSSDVPTKYFYGPAWVSFTLATGVSEAVTITGPFAGRGAWGQV